MALVVAVGGPDGREYEKEEGAEYPGARVTAAAAAAVGVGCFCFFFYR